jgi:hypothetical protein
MDCPNCSKPAPEGATECPACHLVFAKWKAPAPASTAIGSAPIKETAGGAGKWIGLVVLVVAALAYRHFSGAPVSEDAHAGSITAKEAAVASGGIDGFKPPSDHCGYGGRVMDAAAGIAIPGAKVYLDAYTATTGPTGHYRIIVRAMRGGCNAFPSVRHPAYQKNYWTRHFSGLDAGGRLALKNDDTPAARVAGEAGEVTVLNFSMFPNTIPASLIAEISRLSDEDEEEETSGASAPDAPSEAE